MKIWSLASILVVIALLVTTIFIPDVYAQDESGLDISKSADMESASIGDNITYTYTITNTDNVTIEDILLTDDKLGDIPLAVTILAPGDNTTATANHIVGLADFPGPLENTATVSGTSQKSDNITASASTSVELIPYEESIELIKTADTTSASIGDNITYTYVITNTGDLTIDGLVLTDDKLGDIPLFITTLAHGDNTTATANHTVVLADFPGPLENTATVSGTGQNSDNITASASSSVELMPYKTSIKLTKEADRTSASLGDNITYNYVITNTGDLSINELSLTDNKLGDIPLADTILAPGDSTLAAANHIVVLADFPGPLVNMATITGKDQNSDNITANASTSVELIPYDASIELTKTADRTSASPHETIKYTYTLTNNSDVTINNLTLEDNMLGPISLNTTTLDPGDQATATASYTVTVDDLPGPLVNTATAEGEDPLGIPVYATSNQVSVSLTINWSLLTKAEILKLRGVPGNGIDTAPGLQKPFNPNSQAAENAGKNNSNNASDKAQGLQEQTKLKSNASENSGKKK